MTPTFTVLTPTFNRAHTLPRLHEALRAQTMQDFEWLIVDDGSRDGTDELVARWTDESGFPIRYVWQENQGKPAAFNRGITLAEGTFTTVQDSDDWPMPHALQRFVELWAEIPDGERGRYSGITVHTADPDGRLIGRPFPAPVWDGTFVGLDAIGGLVGDKWGFYVTDILRRYPYPLEPGERFVPEGLVWNRICRSYTMRFVDETLKHVEYQSTGLSANHLKHRLQSPRGTWRHYRETVDDPQPHLYRLRAAVNAVRFARHAGMNAREALAGSEVAWSAPLLAPIAALMCAYDRKHQEVNH